MTGAHLAAGIPSSERIAQLEDELKRLIAAHQRERLAASEYIAALIPERDRWMERYTAMVVAESHSSAAKPDSPTKLMVLIEAYQRSLDLAVGKLTQLSKECTGCNGTGHANVHFTQRGKKSVPCDDCADIREVIKQVLSQLP